MKNAPLGTNSAELEFLRTEIRTGLTMSKLALEAHQQDKIDRNRGAARKAYKAVMRFIPKVSMTNDEQAELNTGLAQLRSELKELGEAL